MKLDNEKVLGHSTVGHKSDSKNFSFLADTKPIENRERPWDSTGLKAQGNVKENLNDGDSDPSLPVGNKRDRWPASVLGCSMNVNDFDKGNEKEVRDFVTSNSQSLKNMDSFQDSFFYFDKSVMECELPELIVCYKESTYHVVKDICIDEGVPTQDKFLFECDMDEKSGAKFLPLENDQYGKLMKEKLESCMRKQDVSSSPEEYQYGKDIESGCAYNKKSGTGACAQDVSVCKEENESNKRILSRCDSKDIILTREVNSDSEDSILTREVNGDAVEMITDDVSNELFTLGELFSVPELTILNSKFMSFNCKTDVIEQLPSQNSKEKEVMAMPPLVSAIEESNSSSEAIVSATASVSAAEEQDSGKGEAILDGPTQLPTSEATSSSLVDEVSGDSKLNTGNVSFNFDSSTPTSSKEESHVNLDSKPQATGSTADQPIPNNLQCGMGEASFSAVEHVTGLITYSGPIAYSGSLSLRSDSSTTSTRSFAFPILQSEWNSSPVRMAKPDRRQYRKRRGWRHGMFCCRF